MLTRSSSTLRSLWSRRDTLDKPKYTKQGDRKTLEFSGGSYFQLWEAFTKKEANELGPAELLVSGYRKKMG